jgi:hypothetical protein
MDEDADGVIKVDHVLKVIELLGREHVKLSGKQINQIIDMLQKEEMLETESSIEKLMTKAAGDDSVKKDLHGALKDLLVDSATDLTEPEIDISSKSKKGKKKEGKSATK